MLTPFGLEARKLRLEKALRLLDVALLINRSTAFISAVETGRKPVSEELVSEIIVAMDLNQEEATRLRAAADRTKKEVNVKNLKGDQRELVAAFARKVDELPPEVIADLKKHVFKSVAGELPFKRSRRGMVVPPASAKLIRSWAENVRGAFVPDFEIEFPIMDVLEFRMEKFSPGFYVDVLEHEEMGGDEGRVIAGQNCIALRKDVYEGAWMGMGRHRFTASHEFGHFLMHTNITLARTRDDGIAIYQDSEWQADTFAGALLMSNRHLSKFEDADDAAEQCGMTLHAAEVQWSKYQKEGLVP